MTKHIKSDKECPACFRQYQMDCKCGGILHSEIADTSLEGDPICNWKCDKCAREENWDDDNHIELEA